MNVPYAFAGEALALIVAAILESSARLQDTAIEIIAGPGGPLLLVLGIAGVVVLGYDLGHLARGAVRSWLRRRRPQPSREARVRGLTTLGAEPAEIARAVGLPRDALALVGPVPSTPRPKVPVAARSADRTPSARVAATPVQSPQVPSPQPVATLEPVVATQARALPLSRARNANAPVFGDAA